MFAAAEAAPEVFPPPQDDVSMTLPTITHANTAGKTRRAFLALPANARPETPNEKIQLAYTNPLVRPVELFAEVDAFVIFSVDVAVPDPGLMVAGENEQTRSAGR